MEKIGTTALAVLGKAAATPNTTPEPSSAPSSSAPTAQEMAAASAVSRLFAWCRMGDAGDPRVFLAGATSILADYPVEVMEKIADPRTGTEVLKDYPSLHDLRMACDQLFAPIEREMERQEAHRSHVAGVLQRPPRTPEQQARIDAQVEDARRRLGIAREARRA